MAVNPQDREAVSDFSPAPYDCSHSGPYGGGYQSIPPSRTSGILSLTGGHDSYKGLRRLISGRVQYFYSRITRADALKPGIKSWPAAAYQWSEEKNYPYRLRELISRIIFSP